MKEYQERINSGFYHSKTLLKYKQDKNIDIGVLKDIGWNIGFRLYDSQEYEHASGTLLLFNSKTKRVAFLNNNHCSCFITEKDMFFPEGTKDSERYTKCSRILNVEKDLETFSFSEIFYKVKNNKSFTYYLPERRVDPNDIDFDEYCIYNEFITAWAKKGFPLDIHKEHYFYSVGNYKPEFGKYARISGYSSNTLKFIGIQNTFLNTKKYNF